MTVTGSSGLTALTFDKAGNVYVTDSFQGIIWKTGSGGGAGTALVTDDLLKTTGVPPFGANGIEFNDAVDTLFVANTGNDTIVKMPVASDGTPGKPEIFVNSINGADGIVFDRDGNLWSPPIRLMKSSLSIRPEKSSQSSGISTGWIRTACRTGFFSRRVRRSARMASSCT
ncbi:MAG TPA: SMP-30/gluconolactonase/LRE family protein [Stellaceae bacterium]